MNDRALQTLAQLRAVLDGTQAARFSVVAKERYGIRGLHADNGSEHINR